MNNEFEYQVILKDFLIKKRIECDIIIHYSPEFNEISLHRDNFHYCLSQESTFSF